MRHLSRTCILTAAARAFGARDPDPAVRNPDFLAQKLLLREDISLIADHPLGRAFYGDYAAGVDQFAVLGTVWMMLIRTRFIDEFLRDEIANGTTQIAILGAGLDTRAQRFRDLLQSVKILEADALPTQRHKRERIEAAIGEPPPNLTYCPVDFLSGDIAATLSAAGFSASARTLFVLEGVSMYMSEDAVSRLLKQVASFGGDGSSLVLDYAGSTALSPAEDRYRATLDLMKDWGEPWMCGVPSERAEDFFREQGFTSVDAYPINHPDLIKRYASHADGRVYGWAVFKKLAEHAPRQAAQMPPAYWLAKLRRD